MLPDPWVPNAFSVLVKADRLVRTAGEPRKAR